MTNIDQFESVFNAAVKPVYAYRPVEITKVLVVTDLREAETNEFTDRLRRYLRVLDGEGVEWREIAGDSTRTVGELLEVINAENPHLICTYRNLYSSAWKWPYSLGSHLDVMTQFTDSPYWFCRIPRPAAPGTAPSRTPIR